MRKAQKQAAVQPLLLTVPEVAVSLRVCRKTVYNLMANAGLPWVLLGGCRRVRFDALEAWLKQREKQGV
jgi:excisionase family DNA binding protein